MQFAEIEKAIKEIVPPECGLTLIEPLGLVIAIYVKDIKKFYEHEDLVKIIAGTIKKKIHIRVDKSRLMDPEKAKEEITSVLTAEAKITNLWFNADFSEVMIESEKPGLVIGKGGMGLKEILIRTGWAPIVLRTPTMASSTIEGMRKSEVAYAGDRKKFLLKLGKRINQPSPEIEWVRTVMLGGFREVGRSCLLLQTNKNKILIDVGINPETLDPRYAYPHLNILGFPINEIDAVIISHGHLDHMGFLPYLFACGYDGPVYTTPPTKDLMALLQRDYLNVVKKFWGADAPYTKEDIQKELKNIITINYEEVVDITPGAKLTFYNAGHIIGSAIAHLHVGEGKHNMIYSGDIKFGFTNLFNPAHTTFPRVETLFLESTYGGRNDIGAAREERETKLIEVINNTVQRKGKVLIPVFAVGRSQEILLVMENYIRNNPDWNVPIYIDGMVMEASAIHTAYPEYLKNSLHRRILSNDSPFECPLIKVAENREEIVNGEPAVILAPSGMLSGGPSVEYLKMMAEDEKNTLVFVGYQSALSLGNKIQNGAKEIPIVGENGRAKTLKINMEVTTVEGFSGHSDRRQLAAWIRNVRPKPNKIFTMHGDWGKTEEFARDIARNMMVESRAPLNLESIRLR